MSKLCYAIGACRVRPWRGSGDVRGYRPARGWRAIAELIDTDPITGKSLRQSQWWIFETFVGRV